MRETHFRVCLCAGKSDRRREEKSTKRKRIVDVDTYMRTKTWRLWGNTWAPKIEREREGREGVEGEETWEGRSKAFIVMKYFCLILVACLSIWLSLSLSLYFSLPLSLSPPRPSIVLSRALKKRLVGFAYSSTLKRSRGGKERERESEYSSSRARRRTTPI